MGLKKAMQKVLMPQAFEEVEKVKSEGTKLFVPELGGSYEVWNERPLNPVLVEYCANDVQLLFPMFDEWSNAEREGQYRQRQQNYQQNQHRSRSDNTKVQTFESRIERVKHLSQTRLEDTVTREEQWPQADSRWLFPDFEIN